MNSYGKNTIFLRPPHLPCPLGVSRSFLVGEPIDLIYDNFSFSFILPNNLA